MFDNPTKELRNLSLAGCMVSHGMLELNGDLF